MANIKKMLAIFMYPNCQLPLGLSSEVVEADHVILNAK